MNNSFVHLILISIWEFSWKHKFSIGKMGLFQPPTDSKKNPGIPLYCCKGNFRQIKSRSWLGGGNSSWLSDHWVAHWSWELMSSVGRSFFLEEASGILKALCTCMLGGTLGIEKSSWVTLESATKYHFFKIELTAKGIQVFLLLRMYLN